MTAVTAPRSFLSTPRVGTVLLVRQFRFVAHGKGHGDADLIEACAGLLDADDPETAHSPARRRKSSATDLRSKCAISTRRWMSPGSVTERLSFFHGGVFARRARCPTAVATPAEGEDIEVVGNQPPARRWRPWRDGRIVDAKTIMLLQHLRLVELGNARCRAQRPTCAKRITEYARFN